MYSGSLAHYLIQSRAAALMAEEMMKKPLMQDRTLVAYDPEAEVGMYDKSGINFVVLDVERTAPDEITFRLDTGVWYPYHSDRAGAERQARGEYKRRCAAAKEFA